MNYTSLSPHWQIFFLPEIQYNVSASKITYVLIPVILFPNIDTATVPTYSILYITVLEII